MKVSLVVTIALFILSTTTTAAAQGRGQAKPGGGRPDHAGKPTTQSPRVQSGKPDGPKATGRPEGAGKPATTSVVVTSTTPTTMPLRNANLQARLQKMLGGMDLQDASAGFRNWGQFVAAVHVSNNLAIPFADLKAQMTGPAPVSLGQAIQSLKGTSEGDTLTTSRVRSEVKKAEDAADADLRATTGRD